MDINWVVNNAGWCLVSCRRSVLVELIFNCVGSSGCWKMFDKFHFTLATEPRGSVLIARIPGTHILVEAVLSDRWLRIANWFWIFYFLRAAPKGSWVTMNNDCSFRVQNVPGEENVENLQTPSPPTPKRDKTDFLHFPQRKLRYMTSQDGLGQGHCRQKFKKFLPSAGADVSLCASRV